MKNIERICRVCYAAARSGICAVFETHAVAKAGDANRTTGEQLMHHLFFRFILGGFIFGGCIMCVMFGFDGIVVLASTVLPLYIRDALLLLVLVYIPLKWLCNKLDALSGRKQDSRDTKTNILLATLWLLVLLLFLTFSFLPGGTIISSVSVKDGKKSGSIGLVKSSPLRQVNILINYLDEDDPSNLKQITELLVKALKQINKQ